MCVWVCGLSAWQNADSPAIVQRPSAMTNAERHQLDEQGFVVLENCMGADLLRELRERIHDVFDMERDRAGAEFRIRSARASAGQPRGQGRGLPPRDRAAARGRVRPARARAADEIEQPECAFCRSERRRAAAAARGHVGGPRRTGLLGLQHRLDARRLHDRERCDTSDSWARTNGVAGRRTSSRIPWRRIRRRSWCSAPRAASR